MQKSFIYLQQPVTYRMYGKGKLVVLIHGFPEDGNIFQSQINFLQQHCLVIVPDLPGSGSSAYNASIHTIEAFALCINSILEKEAINTCIIMGHSMGGYISLAFAELFPEKILGLGLIHSTAFADSDEKKAMRAKAINTMNEVGAYQFIKITISNLFSDISKEAFQQEIASLIEAGKKFSTKALQQYYSAMMQRPDRTSVLSSINSPVLFVIGDKDVAAPLKDLEQQIHLPHCSYIHIIENVAHMSMIEAADVLNNYLLDFIKKVD